MTSQLSPAPNVSFEFFPPTTPKLEAKLWESVARLSPMQPKFVSVTYGAGGTTRERTQATVAKISRDTGLKPAAHLTCVSASRDEVLAVARAYRDAGVNHIVALRGDPPDGIGARFEAHPDGFKDSVELVTALRADNVPSHSDLDISVAAYPERHPDSQGWENDVAFLKAKQDAGATRAITQFFFEAETYFRFLDRVRKGGVTMPIVPGIMLQPNFKGLLRFAKLSQAQIPDHFHSLYEGTESDPETRELITAHIAVELCSKLAAQGVRDFHFYTLNRASLALSTCRLLGLKPKEVQP